jgi:topoisomerase-4 subunit A
MAVLLAHTSLESSVSVNLTMVGRDGRPQQKNLLTILHEWIAFRFATVERRSRHRLGEGRTPHPHPRRPHDGLPAHRRGNPLHPRSRRTQADLMARFGLTEIQAEDILEIRLRQLARLEGIRIEKELGDLRTEDGQLARLLDSRNEMTRLILKEIAEDAKRFGDERRTLMEAVTPISQGEISVPDEPVTVIVSKNGWVRSRQGHGIDPAGITYKTGDYPWLVAESRTVWPLIVIDSQRPQLQRQGIRSAGWTRRRRAAQHHDRIPGGRQAGAGANGGAGSAYLVAGSGGYGFIASVADMVARNKAGKAFLSLDKGERPLPPAPVGGETVAVLTQAGRLLLFPLTEIREMAKGKGLMLIDLVKNDEVVGVAAIGNQPLRIEGSGRGGKASIQILDVKSQAEFRGARARRGQDIPFRLKPTGLDLTSNH